MRSFITYVLVILAFATAFFALGSGVLGFFPSPGMDEEDCQRLEDLINEEIEKRGLTG